MPVIKAEFGFFQVQVKRMSCCAVKLYQTVFCITPKRLDTVDMLRSAGKFILPVTHLEMLCKTHINQAVITTPAISIDDTPNRNVPAYYLLQCGFGRIRNDFRIDLAAPLEYAGNDGFATGTAPAFTTDALCAKVRSVKFHNAVKRGLPLAFDSQTPAQFQKGRVDASDADTG